MYIYGFGRNEDVPEGMDISLTAGWTKTQGGIGFMPRYRFLTVLLLEKEHYFNYTARGGRLLQ